MTIEKPDRFNEQMNKESGKGSGSYEPDLFKKEIKAIQEAEFKDDIKDYLKENNIEVTHFSNDEIFEVAQEFTLEMQKTDKSFSLIDLPKNAFEKMLKVRLKDRVKLQEDIKAKDGLDQANSLENFVDILKEKGTPNDQIIHLVLAQHRKPDGAFKLPKDKYEQYSNFLSLLSDKELAQDQGAISQIVNSEPDLLANGSFESVVYRIFDSDTISEQSKISISRRFKIKRIVHGADLKTALLKTQKANQSFENHSKELNKGLSDLETEIEATKKQLASKSGNSTELRNKLQTLIDQKATLNGAISGREKAKPMTEIPLRGAIARLEDGFISVRVPGLEQSLQVPIESGTEALGRATNSLFLYRSLGHLGLAQLIFPGEVFGSDDQPSNHMRTFSNEMLSAMKLSGSGEILSNIELGLMERMLGTLRSKDSNLLDPKMAKEDLENRGLWKHGNLMKEELLEHLYSIRLKDGHLEKKVA